MKIINERRDFFKINHCYPKVFELTQKTSTKPRIPSRTSGNGGKQVLPDIEIDLGLDAYPLRALAHVVAGVVEGKAKARAHPYLFHEIGKGVRSFRYRPFYQLQQQIRLSGRRTGRRSSIYCTPCRFCAGRSSSAVQGR